MVTTYVVNDLKYSLFPLISVVTVATPTQVLTGIVQ